MESSLSSSIQSLVAEVKKELFSGDDNVYTTFVSPSAYETAWLAMIPDDQNRNQPMFKNCLTWILNNQKEGGFWGQHNGESLPTIDTLPATLVSIVALRKWNVGEENIRKGLDFIYSKAEIILKMNYHHLPRWFTITFPATIELAQGAGLAVVFPQGSTNVLFDIFCKRQQIIETENLVEDKKYCTPLLSHLESFPTAYQVAEEELVKHLSEDGSIFQSPSATARAYMASGNLQCLKYLNSVIERCPDGVPAKYPMDEELIYLCMVDHVQRLGLAEYFGKEIEHILKKVHRNHKNGDFQRTEAHNLPLKLFKDALVFRLLRTQGYDVKPCLFSWFLSEVDIMDYMEQNCENSTSVLYAIYKATDLRYAGEHELEKARSFSRCLLEKSLDLKSDRDDFVVFPVPHKVIKQDLSLPWITRMDHLDHRMWIEENKTSPLWTGKASYYRLSCLHNEKLMELASKNYNFRQSIYAKELEELTRWSSKTGFRDIGFGREKTAYCYFAVSASCSLPHDSIARLFIAKSAIIITVADDFYDVEGSMSELKLLTEAVQRWDGKKLYGHGKTIFNALDDLVTQTAAAKYQHQHGSNFLTELRDIWKETFASWMEERTWSETGYLPSMDEYLETGMISIAVHTLILPASRILGKSTLNQNVKPAEYAKITKLLMTVTRLLNDTQSYQKEQINGKMNLVLLHQKENPEAHMKDSVVYVKHVLEKMTREFLEHVFMDDNDETPKLVKQLHISCMKVFHMFFDSTNLYDTKTELLHDIKQAIYVPLHPQPSDLSIKLPQLVTPKPKEIAKTTARSDLIKINKGQLGIGIKAKSLRSIPIVPSPILLRRFA